MFDPFDAKTAAVLGNSVGIAVLSLIQVNLSGACGGTSGTNRRLVGPKLLKDWCRAEAKIVIDRKKLSDERFWMPQRVILEAVKGLLVACDKPLAMAAFAETLGWVPV